MICLDIRDTVNYKEVMKQYNLGPNGGIMTSLNLFSTKFVEVSALLITCTSVSLCRYLVLVFCCNSCYG